MEAKREQIQQAENRQQEQPKQRTRTPLVDQQGGSLLRPRCRLLWMGAALPLLPLQAVRQQRRRSQMKGRVHRSTPGSLRVLTELQRHSLQQRHHDWLEQLCRHWRPSLHPRRRH